MNTAHLWFRSGFYSLLGHIDKCPVPGAQFGALIVPPFGWEDVCSYRPLRLLCRMLAESGVPTMRFDLPGTGDSSGSPRDPNLFASWIRSVGDAASELKSVTGVREVALIGIRLGGVLAILAAREGKFRDLVVWGAPLTGRGLLRELKALHQFEAAEYAEAGEPLPQPQEGMESGGFYISPDTKTALEAIDLSVAPNVPGGRVLLLTRDALPADKRLVNAFHVGGWQVQVKTGNGYGGMMAYPHEAVVPVQSGQTIIRFLLGDRARECQKSSEAISHTISARPDRSRRDCSSEIIRSDGRGIIEEVHSIESSSGSAFAVVSKPGPDMPSSEWCLLLLNAGAVRHIGPNRMWVEAARRWAARGLCSVRVDLPGIGEGEGERASDIAGLYRNELLEEVDRVIRFLSSRLGARKIVVGGLCSGAFCAFHAAVRNPEVRGVILLNPRLFFWDPEVDRRRMLRQIKTAVADSATWGRLARGGFSSDQIKEAVKVVFDKLGNLSSAAKEYLQIPRDKLAKVLDVLRRNQTHLTLIFSEGEPLLREMEDEGYLPLAPEALFRCIRGPNGGHTFAPLGAQTIVHRLIDDEIRNITQYENSVLDVHPWASTESHPS